MNVLFVHNNFPAQFRHVARALAAQPGMRVAAIGSPTSRAMTGIELVKYRLTDADISATHPFARRFDLECRRAEQVLYALSSLTASAFVPDAIVAHCGWGEALPLRSICPKARLVVYCEFYYGRDGRDVGFDPEFPATGVDGDVALHLKNATTLLALAECDQGVAPTRWQRSTFPAAFQDRIAVLHEGVDTSIAKPSDHASFRLPSGRVLTSADEVITFAARNFEPLRGYHIFMRALPRIMAARPGAQIVIVGGNGTAYGAQPPPGQSWKSIFPREVGNRIDMDRVHFTDHLPYRDYLRALQISSAHVYLTYPFVLSWSVIEAMSVGCVVIASDTAPVREVIEDNRNGLLVPFFDVTGLADRVVDVLAHRDRYATLRIAARLTVLDRYDLERTCLPGMLALVQGNEARPAAGSAFKENTPVGSRTGADEPHEPVPALDHEPSGLGSVVAGELDPVPDQLVR
jgi:glycosyltransferase involved in cell wall biosynthesis